MKEKLRKETTSPIQCVGQTEKETMKKGLVRLNQTREKENSTESELNRLGTNRGQGTKVSMITTIDLIGIMIKIGSQNNQNKIATDTKQKVFIPTIVIYHRCLVDIGTVISTMINTVIVDIAKIVGIETTEMTISDTETTDMMIGDIVTIDMTVVVLGRGVLVKDGVELPLIANIMTILTMSMTASLAIVELAYPIGSEVIQHHVCIHQIMTDTQTAIDIETTIDTKVLVITMMTETIDRGGGRVLGHKIVIDIGVDHLTDDLQ